MRYREERITLNKLSEALINFDPLTQPLAEQNLAQELIKLGTARLAAYRAKMEYLRVRNLQDIRPQLQYDTWHNSAENDQEK